VYNCPDMENIGSIKFISGSTASPDMNFIYPIFFRIRTIVHCVTNSLAMVAFLVFQSKWKKYYTIDIKVWLNFFSKYNCLSLDNLYPFISVPFLNKKKPEQIFKRRHRMKKTTSLLFLTSITSQSWGCE
jgi:hypothetical protein